nr:hypothetical protein [Acaricomes phytoseiuli]
MIGMFIAGAMLTKPVHAFSALKAVKIAASAGSFSNILNENFILDRRIVGGMQSVSQALADQLTGSAVLEAPVSVLQWQKDRVTLGQMRLLKRNTGCKPVERSSQYCRPSTARFPSCRSCLRASSRCINTCPWDW